MKAAEIITLADALAAAARYFAAERAAVEVEFAMPWGSVWIGRDGQAYDHPRGDKAPRA